MANKKTEMELIRKRFNASVENEKDERTMGKKDTKFINGNQWDKDVVKQRGKGRLCLVINKLPTFLDQIDGDIRLNTPSIKVKAVDDAADPDTADVLEGIIRYIQRNSRSNKVHAWAGLHAAAGGRGAWRILTEFVSDTSFKQEIIIKKINDAYSVYYDPGAHDDDKQDGNYFFIIEVITRTEYKEEYGKEPVDFEVDGQDYANWCVGDDHVVIAEYFYKHYTGKKTLYEDENGDVFDSDEAEEQNLTEEYLSGLRSRKINPYKIKWKRVDGKRVLDTGDVAGKLFPIVLTWGKQLCVSGKVETRGIARHAKDSQRLYNYARSNEAESISQQPKAPYLMPDKCMTAKQQKIWDRAQDENFPYLPYHVDPELPNLKPTRESPPRMSSGNMQQLEIADVELRDTVGIQKAALGQESNETSGVAIQKRKQESDTGQYAYIDNLGDAIKTESKIILSMIPEIFDVPTTLRILGKDMKEKIIFVNQQGGIDLLTGKYDVDMSIGGSYSTQREEFQEKLTNILPQIPEDYRAVISDLLFEMQDFHKADDVAERLKFVIKSQFPGLIQEEEESDAVDEEGQPVDQPVEPVEGEEPIDPEAVAEQRVAKIELETAEVKLAQEEAKLEGLKLKNMETQKMVTKDVIGIINQVLDEVPVENKQVILEALNQVQGEMT